jgi:hypothetical protein
MLRHAIFLLRVFTQLWSVLLLDGPVIQQGALNKLVDPVTDSNLVSLDLRSSSAFDSSVCVTCSWEGGCTFGIVGINLQAHRLPVLEWTCDTDLCIHSDYQTRDLNGLCPFKFLSLPMACNNNDVKTGILLRSTSVLDYSFSCFFC